MSEENNNSKKNPSKNEQLPSFIRFFFDSKKPIFLRLGIFIIIFSIFIYPLYVKKTAATKKIAFTEIKKEIPQISDEMIRSLSSTTLPPSNKLTSLKKIENTFPVPVSVLETSQGDIWLSTMQDISLFPKGNLPQQIKKLDSNIYDRINNNELPAITAATLDSNEELVIGFRDGQIMLNSNNDWKVIWEAGEPIKEIIKALSSYKNLNFIGSKGLWKWDTANGKLSRYKGFNEENVTSFLYTRTKQLFMSTKSHVWLFTKQGWEEFFKLEDPTNFINTLGDFGNNGLLIGTQKGLLLVSGSSILQQTSLVDQNITSIFSEQDNSFWLGTNQGLKYWEDNSWYQLREQEGLPANLINIIYRDKQERAWLGIPGKGTFVIDFQSLINWIKKTPYQEIVIDKNIPQFYNNACRAAEVELGGQNNSGDIHLENIDGSNFVFMKGVLVCPSMLAGSGQNTPSQGLAFRRADGAVVSFDDGKILLHNINYPSPPYNLPYNFLKEKEKPKFIYLDSANRIWAGSSAGVTYYQDGNWKALFSEPDFKENPGIAIVEDKLGKIWLGTAPKFDVITNSFNQAPLHRFDGTSWLHLTPNEGLAGWGVNDLLNLTNGDIAAATSEGISIIKSEKMQNLGNFSELKNKTTFSLNQDNAGLIWLAHLYFGNGISIYDGKNYSSISGPDKLFSENILYINFDAQNRVWLTSSNGKVGIYPRKNFFNIQ